MNSIKSILYAYLIGLMLVVQLLTPIGVAADGEGTPPPTSTPVMTETPQATETVVETALPSGTPEITVTPEKTNSPTDVPAVTPTPDPNEPTSEPVVATPIATESATPSADEPTVELVATTPAPTEIPTDGEDETKIAPTDTTTPTAEPIVSEEDIIVQELSLGEVLSEIPAETEIVVLDEGGQPEPLATQEAAEAISSGDPIWCPEGQPPTPGLNGCTTSYTTLSELVVNEGAGINANGTLWITSGTAADTNPVIIDGSLYSNWANYSLTLQGGWSGISGDTTTPSNSVFTVPITVTNWNNGIYITGIDASSINLSNIISNTGNRIWIVGTNSNINLENIQIENAYGTGLTIITGGSIQGANITSNHNHIVSNTAPGDLGLGAWLHGAQDILLTGTNQFNGNEDRGLFINSNGDITINDIVANNNYMGGLNIFSNNGDVIINNVVANNNNYVGLWASTFGGGIELNNIITGDNAGSGTEVQVNSGNSVILNNVTANNNMNGVVLNGITGGIIDSTIILNNITAYQNSNYGVVSEYTGDISFTGGNINDNGTGLYVNCVKSITFNAPQTIIMGNTQNIVIIPTCLASPITPMPPAVISQGEFNKDCSRQAAYAFQLPNGDLVSIFCPVSGTVSISELNKTNLPENLPEGYSYASAFTLDILQQGVSIPVITEGGYVKSSFVAQPLLPGNTYTVLYWDPWVNENGDLVKKLAGGSWVPLKDFLLDGDGNTESFDLFPGTDDPRKVISGVNLVDRNGSESIEVSTNFPGIFVLAQH